MDYAQKDALGWPNVSMIFDVPEISSSQPKLAGANNPRWIERSKELPHTPRD